MAFTSYRSLAEVLKTFNIKYVELNFETTNIIETPSVLQEDITFTLDQVAYDVSEAAICENLIPYFKKCVAALFGYISHLESSCSYVR